MFSILLMIMTNLFNVDKMKCSGCSANVEKALQDIDGIESIQIDLDAKTVSIEGEINIIEIANIISTAGYPATPA